MPSNSTRKISKVKTFRCSACSKEFAQETEIADHILFEHYGQALANEQRPLSRKEKVDGFRNSIELLGQVSCPCCGTSFKEATVADRHFGSGQNGRCLGNTDARLSTELEVKKTQQSTRSIKVSNRKAIDSSITDKPGHLGDTQTNVGASTSKSSSSCNTKKKRRKRQLVTFPHKKKLKTVPTTELIGIKAHRLFDHQNPDSSSSGKTIGLAQNQVNFGASTSKGAMPQEKKLNPSYSSRPSSLSSKARISKTAIEPEKEEEGNIDDSVTEVDEEEQGEVVTVSPIPEANVAAGSTFDSSAIEVRDELSNDSLRSRPSFFSRLLEDHSIEEFADNNSTDNTIGFSTMTINRRLTQIFPSEGGDGDTTFNQRVLANLENIVVLLTQIVNSINNNQ